MKDLYIFIYFIILFSCGSRDDHQYKIQNGFLNNRLKSELNDLDLKVNSTGYSPLGKNFINQSNKLVALYNAILEEEDIVQISSLSRELINESQNTKDSVELPVGYIESSLQNLNKANKENYLNNLQLYLITTINSYHNKLDSYFYMFDYINPTVLTESNTIKQGQDFEGKVSIEAFMIGINPEISVQIDPDGKFIKLQTDEYHRGKLKINNPPLGEHRIKIKYKTWTNMQERESVSEFVYHVIDE